MAVAPHELFLKNKRIQTYLLERYSLDLKALCGRPTGHTLIPVGAGICGRAITTKAVVKLDDVNSDPDIVACSLETRSELVVPIMRGDEVLGELDVESNLLGTFDLADSIFVRELGRRIQPKIG